MEFRVDDDLKIAWIKLSGLLSREMILEAFDASVKDPRYKEGMHRLWDFREADLSKLDSETVGQMARYPMKFPSGVTDVKVAFVASRGMEFGQSRIFQARSGERSSSVSVFYSMDEAEAWLRE